MLVIFDSSLVQCKCASFSVKEKYFFCLLSESKFKERPDFDGETTKHLRSYEVAHPQLVVASGDGKSETDLRAFQGIAVSFLTSG